MSAPLQMTSETLNALKGWPNPQAVDFVAKFASSVTDRVPAGSVVRLNSDGEFVLGMGTNAAMPLFTFFASDDPTVANSGGDASTDKGVWIPISPVGNVMALVAVGAYELVTTAYDTTNYNANAFVVNAPLMSTDGVGEVKVGAWTNANTIVGVVSRGVVDNGYGTDAVAFWPYFFPKHSH